MRRRNFMLLTLLLAAAFRLVYLPPTAAGIKELPSADSLFGNFKTVSGGKSWDSVITIATYASTANQVGLCGGFVDFQDVTTGRYVWWDCHGIDSSSGGYDGTNAWSVDDSGISHSDDSPEDYWDAESTKYLTSLAYWYPSRHGAEIGKVKIIHDDHKWYYAVDVSVDPGYIVEFWFNPTTHLLYLTAEISAKGPIVTTYSDYRRVDGVLVPFKQHTNGNITYTAISITINRPLPPSLFAQPGTEMPDYTIRPDSSGSTTVPFVYKAGHIVFPIKIDGKGPFDAILDTGAPFITDPEFAAKLEIKSYGGVNANGVGPGVEPAGLARVSDIEIGGITINNLEDIVVPFPLDEVIVGSEIFKRFAVKVDFDKSLLTLTPLDSYHYTGDGIIVPFHFYGDEPEVTGCVNGVNGEFTIDTGQDQSVVLYANFIRSEPVIRQLEAGGVTTDIGGIGGYDYMIAVRGLIFTLGKAVAIGPVINFSNATDGTYGDQFLAGNIGCPLLHRFNVTFDYEREQIILEPNSHNAELDPWDGLGTSGTVSSQGYKVVEVVPHSPADLAGIKIGDLITQFNGTDITASDAELFVAERLLPNGTILSLTVKHRRKLRSLNLSLKEPF